MPFSYQGFGFTGILLMLALLSVNQLVRYLKGRYEHRSLHDHLPLSQDIKKS